MSGLLRVGDCDLDLVTRELLAGGQRRAVEPRVFALLACLATHPNRVVTKQQLMDTVWSERRVSDGAVARAVMKARQAIGDTGDPGLIRNVPRVGYRLVVVQDGSPTPAQPASKARIAVLPFEDLTREDSLDWVSLGLMSLVAHSLGHDAGLPTVETRSVLELVEGARAAGVDAARAVQSATGAEVVVGGRVERSTSGYALTLEGIGLMGRTIQAPDVSALGPAAAQALRDELAPDAAPPREGPLEFVDPLATAAFARALQAMARQKYAQAANLLRMTLSLAPDAPGVQLELLRALSALGDLQGARSLAERLLANAVHERHGLIAARIHFALAHAHLLQSSFAGAVEQLDAGLNHLADAHPSEERAYFHLLRAKIAVYEQDGVAAQEALERMRQACEHSADRLLPVYRLELLAHLAQSSGDLRKAAELDVETARAARAVHALRIMVTAEGNAAGSLLELGRWTDAASHAEQAFAGAVLLNEPNLICAAAVQGSYVYMVTGVPAAAQRIVEALPEASQLAPLERMWATLARAYHAMSAREHEAALQLLGDAVRQLRDSGNRLNETDVLPWWLCALVRCGRLDEAEAELASALPSKPPTGGDSDLWRLLHCSAQVEHARGRREQALQWLGDILRHEGVPLLRAWATLDAAWLHAEAGRGKEALALLDLLPTEMAAQAIARAVAARARFAAADVTGALREHRRYLDAVADRFVHPYLAELGECYAGRTTTIPDAPALPSQL